MSQINAFVGSVMQAPGVQQQQATDKDRQMRKTTDLQKNSGLPGDRFEHAVESPEAVPEIHDKKKNDPRKKRSPDKKSRKQSETDEPESLLDLKA